MSKFEAINIIVTNHEAINTINANNFYCAKYGAIVSKGVYLEALREELMDEPMDYLVALATI